MLMLRILRNYPTAVLTVKCNNRINNLNPFLDRFVVCSTVRKNKPFCLGIVLLEMLKNEELDFCLQ